MRIGGVKNLRVFESAILCSSPWKSVNIYMYTVRNYLHGLQNSGESMGDSDLHSDFGPVIGSYQQILVDAFFAYMVSVYSNKVLILCTEGSRLMWLLGPGKSRISQKSH
jgi:hypothetical protein